MRRARELDDLATQIRMVAGLDRTQKAVVAKVRKAIEQAEQGIPFANERQTVKRFLTRWLEHMRTRLRPRTWAGYASSIQLHLVPCLGKVPLAKLTPAHVEMAFH